MHYSETKDLELETFLLAKEQPIQGTVSDLTYMLLSLKCHI